MTIRKVLYMGDPRLLEVAQSVAEFDTPELAGLIVDLLETMEAKDGAGLAAPQIGVGLRVIAFGYARGIDYPDCDAVPPTVLINPVIEPLSHEQEDGWEGCLSVPGMRGLVPRYRHIRYRGADPKGITVDRVVTGFHARVVQHECDHLDGILYPRRIQDMRNFGFLEELIGSGKMQIGNTPYEHAENGEDEDPDRDHAAAESMTNGA